MSLISNGLLMCVVCLGLVAGSMVLGDVLLDVTRDVGCDVLVVSVVLLLVDDGLDLLVDFSLVSFPVNNWGDFVVGVLEDVLVNDGVEDVPGVSSTNLVIDSVLGRLSESESLGSGLVSVGVLVHNGLTSLLVAETAHDSLDDVRHIGRSVLA